MGKAVWLGARASSRIILVLLAARAATGCRRAPAAPLGRVAFVRGDTLFLQALPGGRLEVHGTGRQLAAPRWSPSGKWLAFRAADGLHLSRVDGSGGQTLAGPETTDFAWAPSDDRLAYVAGGNLIVARAGGMAVALAERTRDADVQGVAWSADGQWLAYGVMPTPGAPPAARPALWRIPARGGTATAVPLPATAFVGAPLLRGWTPDGSRVLVLLPGGDLRTGTVATGGAPLYALPLVPAQAPERWADSVLPYPDFVAPAPGGAGGAVAFVAGGGEATWRNKALVLGRPGAAPQHLTRPGRAALAPAWAPDGRRLAWTVMPALPLAGGEDAAVGLRQRRVVVAGGPGGGAPVPLGGPPGRQELPRWSADGRHLLLASIDSTGTASLWLVAPGEAGRQVVTPLRPPAGAASPAWSGQYGHVAWGDIMDYWPGPRPRAGASAAGR